MSEISTPDRLKKYLAEYAEKYPGAWKQFELFRMGRGKELDNWPEWCWCPLAGSYAIVNQGKVVPQEKILDISILVALATWRITQGIYKFDSDLYKSLWETSLDEKLPIEVFYRLPEWCVYVESPAQYRWCRILLYGFFVHLEWDANSGRTELRFLFDTEKGFIPQILHLTSLTITECLKSVWNEARKNTGIELSPQYIPELRNAIIPFISVTLYLCSQAADIYDLKNKRDRPGNPKPTKTKKGMRVFPVSEKTTWLVGYRIGASLRKVYSHIDSAKNIESTGGVRSSPRPHIRRAHWHSYWTGPKTGPQKVVLKWLPPSLVSGDGVIPTIHPVE